MKDPLEALKQTFFLEAQEILANLEDLLVELDHNLQVEVDLAPLLQGVFRQVHTLKGASGMLEEFYSIEALAHAQEDALDALRSGEVPLTREMMDLFFQVLDLFKKLVEDAREGKSELLAEYEEVLEKLKISCKSFTEKSRTQDSESRVIKPETLNLGLPTRDAREEEVFWSGLAKPEGKIPKEVPEVRSPGSSIKNSEILNIGSQTLDSLKEVLKVPSKKLDHLLDQVGELVISYTLISQNPLIVGLSDSQLQKNLAHLAKIIRDLQDQVMSLRMIPLNQTFQKMKRIVRDAARKTGKDVELRIVGGDTELDKTMIEQLGDPLVHLIRNAVDHGIETPEERERVGKPKQGVIWLQAQHQRGSIVVEVKDDGRGICKERILEKARKTGLLSDDVHLSDQEVLELILHPGFSTAQDISILSGRGVGLDVVKQKIQDLRGKLEIQSVEGQGTTMTITLPLTLAIIDGMIVKVAGQRYILPLFYIERMLRPQPEEIFTIQGKGEVIRGGNDRSIPVIRLHKLWGVEPEKVELWEGLVVVVRDGKHWGGLFVDDLLEQQQVVIKELGDLKVLKGISGGTILGDGTVGLILDVEEILETAFQRLELKLSNGRSYNQLQDFKN